MGLSILVADDDPHIRELIQAILQSQGHEVTTFGTVGEALKLARARTFDVIVTDLIFPGQDGVEFITELRRGGSDARIIAISGGGQLESGLYLEIAKRLRVDGVLAKPFDGDQLRALLDDVTKRRPVARKTPE